MWEFMGSILCSKIFWFTAIVFSIYLYVKKISFSYWAKHGVPHDEPSFPVGNFSKDFFMRKITFGDFWKEKYEKFKHHPFCGAYMFHVPVILINDPELLKCILIKDFTKFTDRGLNNNVSADPLSDNLFFMNGERWRVLRAKLSPSFSVIKLKSMFPMLMEVGNDIVTAIDKSLLKSDIVELKNLMSRFSVDVIFNVAFGFNSYTLRGQGDELYYYGNLALQNSPLRNFILFFAPGITKVFNLPYFNRKASKFFTNLFIELVEKRRADKIKRPDMLSSLVELLDNETLVDSEESVDKESTEATKKKMDILQAAAQAFIFFLAGYETSSSIITYALYELALHPEVQVEVQKEIDEAMAGDEGITYDTLLQLKYLDMVFAETMRLHPPIPMLNRICVEDYQIPNSSFCIPKGMPLIISLTGLQYDPAYFPDPYKFDPTRFSKENMENMKSCTYLPFGEGPRYCIGNRLGLMEIKIAMIKYMSNFTVSVCEKTTIPLQHTADSVLQAPKDGVYLRITRRKSK